MKIAYLLLAHAKPVQLGQLVSSLASEASFFFIHIDRKSDLCEFANATAPVERVTYLRDRIDVKWGGFSMVEATLCLMRLASSRERHDYYILLSESDYPIRSNQALSDKLSVGDYQYIDYSPLPYLEHDIFISRLEYFGIPFKNPRSRIRAIITHNLLTKLPKRNYEKALGGVRPYGGSQWWALTHDCVTFILDYAKSHRRFVNFFKRSITPDEIFFHTIISASPFTRKIKPSLVYVRWNRRRTRFVRSVWGRVTHPHLWLPNPGKFWIGLLQEILHAIWEIPDFAWPGSPMLLDSSDIPALRASNKFFARKFDLSLTPEVFDHIDQALRR